LKESEEKVPVQSEKKVPVQSEKTGDPGFVNNGFAGAKGRNGTNGFGSFRGGSGYGGFHGGRNKAAPGFAGITLSEGHARRQVRKKIFTTALVFFNLMFLGALVFAVKYKSKNIEKDLQISNFDRLTRSFSHEILNPLNAVSLCSQSVERALEKQSSQIEKYELIQEKFNIIQSEIQRLTGVVRGLRSLSGNINPDMQDISVLELFNECSLLFRDQAGLYNIIIETVIQGKAGDDIVISADRNLVKQVLINLVKNSIEALKERKDSGPGRVILKAEKCVNSDLDYDTLISVEDNGPGIKTKKIEKIFEYSFTDKPDGLGLGLAISQRIISAHKWKISAENRALPEKGARISIFVLKGSYES
jgi:signal transduction histidine kinase